MVFSDLFPHAVVSSDATASKDTLVFPYERGFLHLPKSDLTEREMALIQLLAPNVEEEVTTNSWLSFLQGEAALPITKTDLQLVYLHHSTSLPEDLRELLEAIFPNSLLVTKLSNQQSLLVLDASDTQDTSVVIKDILPTVESDFGISLKVFIGNAWIGFSEQDLQTTLTEEYKLFQTYDDVNAQQSVTTFSQALLWAMAKEKEIDELSQRLLSLMDKLKDGRELVTAMWQEHGNLVQTAQRLFIHRNSLQYRLDKCYQATGLNLKDLDDLALAYLLILKD
ncbi:helix-turn-helix domain-containing protein [Streptococcus pluranimalium]